MTKDAIFVNAVSADGNTLLLRQLPITEQRPSLTGCLSAIKQVTDGLHRCPSIIIGFERTSNEFSMSADGRYIVIHRIRTPPMACEIYMILVAYLTGTTARKTSDPVKQCCNRNEVLSCRRRTNTVFRSNGWPGYGGYDIYMTRIRWMKPGSTGPSR